jgi:hypothetical protein
MSINNKNRTPTFRQRLEMVNPSFKWRSFDKDNTMHALQDMTTKQLFNAFRMVWNHSVPPEGRLQPYEQYDLSDFYTLEYRMAAIQHMSNELMKRFDWADMRPEWRDEIRQMMAYLLTVESLKGELK